MKRIEITLLAVCAMVIVSCKPGKNVEEIGDNTFTISGTLEGIENEFFYARVNDTAEVNGYRIDTLFAENGKFNYTGKVNSLEKRDFYTRNESIVKKVGEKSWIPSKANNLSLYVFPGAKIEIQGKLSDYIDAYPSGDSMNNDLTRLNKQIYPLLNESANKRVAAFYEQDSLSKIGILKEAEEISLKALDLKKEFIMNNPNSVVSVETLLDMISRRQISNDEAINAFGNFNPELAETSFYGELEKRIQGIKATEVGMMVPDINTTATLDGQVFDLKDYRGKYLLIDFWGTWCGPCVAEMPELSEFYHKNKDKLNVVGVNSGDTRERVENFLERNKQYDWRQVMNQTGDVPGNFVNKFNVTGFPTKIIVDADGKIVKKYVGYDKEMYTFLKEQLGL